MSSLKQEKKANNAIVNLLTRKQVKEVAKQVFSKMYIQRKGKRRKNGVSYPIPYVIFHEGNYWANPFAFSFTKEGRKGYPTLPWKLSDEQTTAFSPTSTTRKSSWVPRLPIHCVLWRFYNDGKEIPAGCQVSHIGDQPLLLNEDRLVVEDGITNRSRTACLHNGWHKEKRSGVIRCPHSVVCKDRIPVPDDREFLKRNMKPPGLPGEELKDSTDKVLLSSQLGGDDFKDFDV